MILSDHGCARSTRTGPEALGIRSLIVARVSQEINERPEDRKVFDP
jgi:hypothetical protein